MSAKNLVQQMKACNMCLPDKIFKVQREYKYLVLSMQVSYTLYIKILFCYCKQCKGGNFEYDIEKRSGSCGQKSTI